MKNISQSKINYYCRNRRSFLNNPRYKSRGRVKTKPTFNQRIKEAQNRFIEQCGPYIETHDPNLYESLTGKKAKKPVLLLSKPKAEVKKIDTRSDELDAYQKKCQAEHSGST